MKNILIKTHDDKNILILTDDIKEAFLKFFLSIRLYGSQLDRKTLNLLSQRVCRYKKVLKVADIHKLHWDQLPLDNFSVIQGNNNEISPWIHYFGRMESMNDIMIMIECMRALTEGKRTK